MSTATTSDPGGRSTVPDADSGTDTGSDSGTAAGGDPGSGASTRPGAGTGPSASARERADIIIARATSAAGPVLLIAGVASVPAPFSGVAGWWVVLAALVSFAVVAAVPVSWWAGREWIRRVSTAVVILVPLTTLTFDAASGDGVWQVPWTWTLEPLAIGAAIVILPVRWAYVYAITSVASVPALAILSGAHPEHSWWGTVGLHVANIVFVTLIDAMRSQLARQATADEVARSTAESRALALAWQRERTRVDGVVHDEVLATLLAGAVATPATREAIAEQAGQTLGLLERWRELDVPTGGAGGGGPLPLPSGKATGDFREDLRVLAEGSGAHFSVSGPDLVVPTDVRGLVTAAARQALRNCALHAPGAAVTLGMDTTHGVLLVTVTDSGPGFDPTTVAPQRLGIRVGILERMRSITGGSARVLSGPGTGTRILLTWQPPSEEPS